MIYRELSNEWRMCFDLAVQAFWHRSLPVGCIVLDAAGKLISKARAAMVYGSPKSNMTQHAEIMALSKIPVPSLEQSLTMYSTIEPCPMCFGAINVARVACLHFGTRDPWAGSTDLVNGNWYMRRKQIDIRPAGAPFQRIMAIFLVYAMMRKPGGDGFCDLSNEFVERWETVTPDIRQAVKALIESDFLTLRSTEAVFNMLGVF